MKRKTSKIVTLSTIGGALLVLMTGVQIAASIQSANLDLLFPGDQIITDSGEGLDGNYINYEVKSQDEALKKAQDMTQLTAEEGMTLIKNDDNTLPMASTTKVTILGYYSWHNNMSGGEDPANTTGAISLGKGLANKFQTNEAVTNLYASVNDDFADPASKLDTVKGTFSEYDTAVVTLKRNSGEGND